MTGLLQKKNIKICVAAVSLFCIFCLVHFALSAPLAYGDAFSAAETMALSVRTGNTFRRIALWTAEDGRGYFFLPAYAETEKCCFLYEDNLELVIDGRSVRSGQYLDDISLEKPYILSLTSGDEEPVKMEVIFLRSENLPAVYIDTESGSLDYVHEDKANREAAEMEIVDASGRVLYQDTLEYLKGHGNSTWTKMEKKPYHIKLKAAEALLGMGSGRHWILFANAIDVSLLRNWTVYHLAEEAGIDYTAKTRFIDLYVNNEYRGNYQLAEKIEIGTDGVNIRNLEKSDRKNNEEGYQDNPRFEAYYGMIKGVDDVNDPTDVTGGYLLERNFGSRYDNRASGFITEAYECFAVRSPAYAGRTEMTYIHDFVQSVENSILAADGVDAETGLYYTELIDLDSFAMKYLLEEIVLNEAQGATSSWFYKPENTRSTKLYAGPPWDYDKSLGNEELYKNPRVLSKLCCYWQNSSSTKWFEALYRKDEFLSEVRDCYKKSFLPALEKLLNGELEECASQIRQSAYMNDIRWQVGNAERQDFAEEAEAEDGRAYEERVKALKSWLTERIGFLNEVWLEGREYCLIRCLKEDGDTTCYIDSVQKGDILTELPTLRSGDGRLPLYWYDAEKDIICEPGYEVTQDLKLVPIYE